MTYFLKSGDSFRPSSEAALDLHAALPVGTYTIKKDVFNNLFLEIIENFTFSGKRYGDNTKNTDRIFNTFMQRTVSTGVMLAGEKGSGKSLLAKTLAMKGYENNIPTIVINEAWCGEQFNQFIQMITQPAIIIFDEFEKVYDRDDQEQILTLLDGVYPSKKLFILTCNDKYRVDHHMRNRPGRIYYMIDFKGLSPNFIEEYCTDNLNNKTHIDQIKKVASLFLEFNFDMLKALIEEMNRYNESPQEAMAILNAKPEMDTGSSYTVEIEHRGITVVGDNVSPNSWNGNPLSCNIGVDYDIEPDNDDARWIDAYFTPGDLKQLDPDADKFIFVNEDNIKLTLTRKRNEKFNYWNAF